MQQTCAIEQIIGHVPFIEAMNELLVNTPGKMIYNVPPENRFRVKSFEAFIAMHTNNELIELMAPWRFTDDDGQILIFLKSLRLCIQRRHPDWKR